MLKKKKKWYFNHLSKSFHTHLKKHQLANFRKELGLCFTMQLFVNNLRFLVFFVTLLVLSPAFNKQRFSISIWFIPYQTQI